MNVIIALTALYLCIRFSKAYTMIKQIDNYIYIGGKNVLVKYIEDNGKLELKVRYQYVWDSQIMNGSDIGFQFHIKQWPVNYSRGPQGYAFDTCLNWKQEHLNATVRDSAFDFQHWRYHTPSGDWLVMNYSCMNSFIKSVEKYDNNTLWVCGTFGAFPRAFSVDINTLKFIKFVDVNVMSCSRYEDEPMVTYRDKLNNLYVASGWGLYRPDKKDPDVPDNNSTMLYADWKLYRNLFTLPSAMAWVLSSDVNFINAVKETDNHLYFFGHEINNQYGLNNQEDRHAWQSFMVRICKNDLGFKYLPSDILNTLKRLTSKDYASPTFYPPDTMVQEDFMVSLTHEYIDFNSDWYDGTAHLPKTHFVTPIKVNFGCYIGRRPRGISDNHHWGDTNVIYLNQLADVIFDPDRKIRFSTKSGDSSLGCTGKMHEQIPLVGIFNREGLSGTNVEPSGALCQLQINENIFVEMGSQREQYRVQNYNGVENAYEDIMRFSSTSYSNFYSRTIHRTNGYTLHPYWNQGVSIGGSYKERPFAEVGKCQTPSFYKNLSVEKFLKLQNFSNLAWPNELPNRLSSISSSFCQYSAAELYSFNASFVLPGIKFKKLFLVRENISNYAMNDIKNPTMPIAERKQFSPLMIVNIISTHGHLYRVVLCDFDNGMRNHGEDKFSGQWYNWCIFRFTDQPYLYRQYTPMENRKRGQSVQFRASSLLLDKKIVTSEDESRFPINRDPQFHVVKDVLRKGNHLHVITTNNIRTVNMEINCAKDYATCIDCASDPDCMWNNGNKKCIKYNEAESQKESIVQDVLDRGFKCAQFIKTTNENVDTRTNKLPLTIYCNNSEYWRGEIQWKINEKLVGNDPDQFIIHTDQKYLTILHVNNSIKSVKCHGVKEDHDKLFNGAEYDWITKGDYSTQFLSVYEGGQPVNGWKVAFICLILLILLAAIGALIYWFRYHRNYQPGSTREPPSHTDVNQSVPLNESDQNPQNPQKA